MLFLHISSRVSTDKYQGLHKEMGHERFPFMAFIDGEGNLIARHRGKRSVGGFKELGDKVRVFLEAKKHAEGDPAARAQAAILKLDFDLDKYTFEQAQSYVRDIGELTGEQEAMAESVLASVEVNQINKDAGSDMNKMLAAGQKCIEMRQAGRIPNDFFAKIKFYDMIRQKAYSTWNVAEYEEALNSLKKFIADDSAFRNYLTTLEKELTAIKEGPKAPPPK